MATEALKSTNITNRDATPPVLNSPFTERCRLTIVSGFCTSTAAIGVGSTYRLCSIPSNCRVSDVLLHNTALNAAATTPTGNIGIYRSTKDGGAVVDADFFSADFNLATVHNGRNGISDDSATYSITKQEQPIWQAVGMSSDPKSDLDVVVTLTAVGDTAGTIQAQVYYVE